MLNFIAKLFKKPKRKYKDRKIHQPKPDRTHEREVHVLKCKIWRLQRKISKITPNNGLSNYQKHWTPEKRKAMSEQARLAWAKRKAEREANGGHTTGNGVS